MINQRDIFLNMIDCDCRQNTLLDTLSNTFLKCYQQSKMLKCYKHVRILLLCYHCKLLGKCYSDKYKRTFLMSHLHSIQDLKDILLHKLKLSCLNKT